MLIVSPDADEVERQLRAGKLACPSCSGELRPHGRTARPAHRRRSRCRGCRASHVLGPDTHLVRRRDPAGLILAALADKAAGLGHRKIADRCALSELPTRVRGWIRSFSANAERIRAQMTAWAARLDSSLRAVEPGTSPLGDALEAVGLAARAASLRLTRRAPSVWASRLSGGYLLWPNTKMPWPLSA